MKVQITHPAASARDRLHRRERKQYDAWLTELKCQGCRVAGYRMTGDLVDRLCVRHLSDNIRAITAFEAPEHAVIIAIGPHDTTNPDLDVYTQIYHLLGITPPSGERTKPACCDNHSGLPPEAAVVADTIAANLTNLARANRRRR
ncbi:hypothetical protein ACTG9Q_09695 [Actinokineospora sp. 24-640]